jgi:hypothetical protein
MLRILASSLHREERDRYQFHQAKVKKKSRFMSFIFGVSLQLL